MNRGEEVSDATADSQFALLVSTFAGTDGVTLGTVGRGFGSGALQVNGRIFAMVTRGRIVMKLPRARVADLIGAGQGSSFDAGRGKPMKEWVQLEPMPDDDLLGLARESRDFVSRP